MSIYQDIQSELATELATTLNSPMSAADINVVGIRASTAAEQTANGRNTKLAIEGNANSVNYRFIGKVFINRLNLADLTKLSHYHKTMPYSVPTSEGLSVYTLLTQLKNLLGVRFSVNDLVETFSVRNEETNTVDLTLTAKEKSPGWYGTTMVHFVAPVPIANNFGSTYLADI